MNKNACKRVLYLFVIKGFEGIVFRKESWISGSWMDYGYHGIWRDIVWLRRGIMVLIS